MEEEEEEEDSETKRGVLPDSGVPETGVPWLLRLTKNSPGPGTRGRRGPPEECCCCCCCCEPEEEEETEPVLWRSWRAVGGALQVPVSLGAETPPGKGLQ